jgi:hypothetical protein
LNKEGIDESSKKSLIVKQQKRIKKISSISDKNLWSEIISQSLVEVNWENVFKYYEYVLFDGLIESYINDENNFQNLSTKPFLRTDDMEEIVYTSFRYDFVSNTEIKLENRVRFLTANVEQWSKEVIGELLDLFQYPYNQLNKPQKRPKLKATETNLALVEKLKKKGFLGKVKSEGDYIRVSVRYYVPGRESKD